MADGARWDASAAIRALRAETIPDLITQVYAGDAGAGTSGGAIPPGARDLLTPYDSVRVRMTCRVHLSPVYRPSPGDLRAERDSTAYRDRPLKERGDYRRPEEICPAAVRAYGPQSLEAGGARKSGWRSALNGLGQFGIPRSMTTSRSTRTRRTSSKFRRSSMRRNLCA